MRCAHRLFGREVKRDFPFYALPIPENSNLLDPILPLKDTPLKLLWELIMTRPPIFFRVLWTF
jgi:hypothetical protein